MRLYLSITLFQGVGDLSVPLTFWDVCAIIKDGGFWLLIFPSGGEYLEIQETR